MGRDELRDRLGRYGEAVEEEGLHRVDVIDAPMERLDLLIGVDTHQKHMVTGRRVHPATMGPETPSFVKGHAAR
jgi:hypothetical protein